MPDETKKSNNVFASSSSPEAAWKELVDQWTLTMNLSKYVPLPMIAVMGDTSSGKSSLLSSVSGIELPSASTLATDKCPVLLHLKTVGIANPETSRRRSAIVSIQWKTNSNSNYKNQNQNQTKNSTTSKSISSHSLSPSDVGLPNRRQFPLNRILRLPSFNHMSFVRMMMRMTIIPTNYNKDCRSPFDRHNEQFWTTDRHPWLRLISFTYIFRRLGVGFGETSIIKVEKRIRAYGGLRR